MESERFARGRGAEALRCTPCREVEPAFLRAVAYGVYDGELRELLHLLKYDGMTALAEPLGSMLAQAIGELRAELDDAEEWFVVPVPLAGAKRRGRGFNQALLLAEVAVRRLRAEAPGLRLSLEPELLRRTRATESQFGLTPHQRRTNLRGAFAVTDPARVKGRGVLLVDDIYTTGTTARMCSAVLRRAGAETVLVVTLARAQRETVALWDGGAGTVRADSGEAARFGS